MSSPAVTCSPEASLAQAALTMKTSDTGSVVVTEAAKVIGILTERDLLRASAAGADPAREATRLWMTASPDVLGPDEEAASAWSSLTHHRYRHLPVVDDGSLVGVVSLRDLMRIARLRPVAEEVTDVPRGLEGVVVAETEVGDVRGLEGFYHYRQYSAVELAASRSFEDVWHLLAFGALPDRTESEEFSSHVRSLRSIPRGVSELLAPLARDGSALEVLRTAVSVLGSELGWGPSLDADAKELRDQAVHLAAVVPAILAATYRLRSGKEPVEPRPDLGHAANYLWMLGGSEVEAELVRAIEQYMILTIDHGFNSSTFTARVIVSTGADLASAVCGAIGALSGPLHGGAPSRALEMLDVIEVPQRAEPWLRSRIEAGGRLMGFGHRVYRTEDPRSAFLREVARGLGAPRFELASVIEREALRLLDELKPDRQLCTNVEFYAGVVMDACGIPSWMFTPTFAAARTVGWCAQVQEQARDNRLIRPAARYVGPPPPEPVPAA